ncbi:MAG: hypothetical protein L0Z62_01660 [Gemmataceae bacterium]|nr:hypothetical protein [Gemmataceae bacterium]
MTEPSGKVVARPTLTRACGCRQEFQIYAVDKYRAQRQAKFEQTRCPACVAKLQAEQRQVAQLPKGEALKLLPPGTQVALTLGPDGAWAGTLTAGGTTVELAGPAGAGPQAVIGSLAQLWATESGAGGES